MRRTPAARPPHLNATLQGCAILEAVWTLHSGGLGCGALSLTWVGTISTACTDSDTVNVVVRDGRDRGQGRDALDASWLDSGVVDSSLANPMNATAQRALATGC